MNLTDKARRGSQEAMEALFDMTKNDVAYLCRLLLGDSQAASVAVPRIYRSLWEQVLAGRITTEEDFAQAALVKTAAFCKTVLTKKASKSFRIPQNRDFVLGMGEGRLSLQGEPWELAVDNLPPLHRFLYVLPVLCGYTQAQLAKLFHTNEETVRLAQVAEAICLKRLFAALSRLLGREISLTQEEFHRALKANRPRAEVPPTVDSAVLHAIRAVCRPIQRRLAKKRKRVALAAGTVWWCWSASPGASCTPLWPGTGERLRKSRLCLLRGGGVQRRGDFQRNLRRVPGELHPFRKLHCLRGHQLLRNLRRGQRSCLSQRGKPACGLAFSRKKYLTDGPLCGYIKRVWRPRCRPWKENPMEQKTLLITGFEPFQQETINPSWEAVALLPETIGPWRLEKLRLPVVFGKAADLAIARAQQLCPQAILAVGQAGGRGAVTPELVAINTRDAAIPDNEGNAFQGQPVVPGGGDGYFATAPVRQMVQAAAAQGIPCKLSYTAGAYVCNDLFYRLLHQYRGTGVLVDFIHVPFLPEQAKNGEPSMALADMARALEVLILALEP